MKMKVYQIRIIDFSICCLQVKASNDIFGDSCWGQMKYLETAYKCGGKFLSFKAASSLCIRIH